MKKILFALITVLIASCSQMSGSLEDRATDQLKKTMKEVLNNTDDATLSGVRTEYQSDSLCVIEFTLKAKNGEGKMISQSMEYLYIDMDRMKDDNLKGQLEGFYYIGLPGSVMYGLELLREEDALKEYKEQGFDPEYVLSNTVFNVRDKYSQELIKFANHSPSHPNISDKLIFSASWLKVIMNGREVNKESKDIKL